MKTNSRRYRRHRNPELTDKKDGAFFRPTEKAVQKKEDAFFQPKLTMGQPGDSYEREADSVADKVVSGKAADRTAVQRKEISDVQAKPDKKEEEKKVQKKGATDKKEEEKPIQKKDDKGPKEEDKLKSAPDKKEEEKPVQKQGDDGAKEEEGPAVQAREEEEPAVQRKEEPEKKPAADEVIKEERDEKGKGSPAVMAKANNGQLQDGGDNLAQQLREQRNNGKTLSPEVQQEMGNAIGADFGSVRIHTDDKARAMSEDIGAQAFTHGNDVYFNSGRYDTESTKGKRLLAHELTHVVQQGAAPATEGKKAASTASRATPGVQREISTPLPPGVEPDRRSRIAKFPVKDFTVIVKPDRKAKKKDRLPANKARTRGIFDPKLHPKKNKNNQIESVTMTKKLIIQTVYGSRVTSSSLSEYGRGKIKSDTNKTLGYHEGWHGTDYINYIKSNDFPMMVINEPISIKEYNKRVLELRSQIEKYAHDMEEKSKKDTDLVKDPPDKTTP